MADAPGCGTRIGAAALELLVPGAGWVLLGRAPVAVALWCVWAFAGAVAVTVLLGWTPGLVGVGVAMVAGLVRTVGWLALGVVSPGDAPSGRAAVLGALAFLVVGAGALWLGSSAVRAFVVEPFRIPTSSMAPTVLAGDHVVVRKGTWEVGDVVAVQMPGMEDVQVLKRVVATGGQRVRVEDQALHLDGRAVPRIEAGALPVADTLCRREQVGLAVETVAGREVHVTHSDRRTRSEGLEVEVPEGHVYLLGDHRGASLDSRVWGPVPEEDVVGRAERVWMSWDRCEDAPRWERWGLEL